jgi:hypothetical protein
MTEHPRETAEKLPQARRYLRAARAGLDALLQQKPVGSGYFFYLNGLFATMRACQHVLFNRDSTLSQRHKEVIDNWRQTNSFEQIPELGFIKKARDMVLKDASFICNSLRGFL